MALGEPAVGLAAGSGGGGGRNQQHRWRRLGAGLLWVLGCSALGSMLMVLPWLWVWERNYFAGPASGWAQLWLNPYLRGAITGLGVVNVGISFCELLRLWRWWPPWRRGNREEPMVRRGRGRLE